ncbi:MAG: hypothetical protein IPM91_12280 [Bacteroidetes bacterium]|nr:hypothetical protein [Bacteroidota bacterium]
MKKTNRPMNEGTALFAFLPEDGEIHRQYAKQLKNEEPMSFEEMGTSIASIGDVFERMMSDFRRMTVEEHLGFPDFPDADTLSASEIERELFEVLDMLEDHNILIDTNADYPDEDLYRFITGELMQEEMEVYNIKDMYCHFIYEEFHEKEETEAMETLNDLLKILFSNDWRFLNSCLSDQFKVDGRSYNQHSKRMFQETMNSEFGTREIKSIDSTFLVLNHSKAVLSVDLCLEKNGTGLERKIDNICLTLEKQKGQFKVVEISGLFPFGT